MDAAVHEEFIANSRGGSGLVPWQVDPLHWTGPGIGRARLEHASWRTAHLTTGPAPG